MNSRFAYVAISRARFEGKIYINDAQAIGLELGRAVSKRAAIENQQDQKQDQARQKQLEKEQFQGHGLAL